MTDPYADLRRALYVRRVSLGFSQKHVSERMGYKDASTVSHLENGYPKLPGTDVLRAWANALFYDLTLSCVLTSTRTLEKPRTFDITPDLEHDE